MINCNKITVKVTFKLVTIWQLYMFNLFCKVTIIKRSLSHRFVGVSRGCQVRANLDHLKII